jgi:hypothetical protein
MRTALLAIALLTFSAAAAAQNVYKHTDPSGRVTYTDDPNPGNGTVTPIEVAPAPGGSPAPGLSAGDKKLLEESNKRAAELDRATQDIVSAFAALRAAEAQRDSGVEPLEGERSGRRFRPEYWARQQSLKQAVDDAKARLDDALARRNALR